MIIPIINKSTNRLPAYETELAAGMDLRANLAESILIQPMQRLLVPTGLYLELPQGMEAQVRPRSGLALKHGITILNSPGTIDADYRGEIKVLLINLSDQAFEIGPGDRIAQMIVASFQQVSFQLVEVLSESGRGDRGYGHTGNS